MPATIARPIRGWVSKRRVLVTLGIGPRRFKEIEDKLPLRRIEVPGVPPRYDGDDLARLVEKFVKPGGMPG